MKLMCIFSKCVTAPLSIPYFPAITDILFSIHPLFPLISSTGFTLHLLLLPCSSCYMWHAILINGPALCGVTQYSPVHLTAIPSPFTVKWAPLSLPELRCRFMPEQCRFLHIRWKPCLHIPALSLSPLSSSYSPPPLFLSLPFFWGVTLICMQMGCAPRADMCGVLSCSQEV